MSGLVNFVQSGGDRGGKLLNNFGGPLNPYWNLVTSVFWVVDFLQTRVAQYQAQGGNLVLLALGLIMAVLSAFILIIYLITLPDKHVSTPTASHAHAE